MKFGVVAIKYEEPYWREIERILKMIPDQVYIVDRSGIGSMSEAYNRGFDMAMQDGNYDWLWFVSNVTFNVSDYEKVKKLITEMTPLCAAVNPVYNSDHPHLRPYEGEPYKRVPFIEFTAPFINAKVFQDFKLDENLPYWGQDLDWSYRVKQLGFRLFATNLMECGHTYIRFQQKSEVTAKRLKARKKTDMSTRRRLVELYGKNWRDIIWPKN